MIMYHSVLSSRNNIQMLSRTQIPDYMWSLDEESIIPCMSMLSALQCTERPYCVRPGPI